MYSAEKLFSSHYNILVVRVTSALNQSVQLVFNPKTTAPRDLMREHLHTEVCTDSPVNTTSPLNSFLSSCVTEQSYVNLFQNVNVFYILVMMQHRAIT